LRIDTEQAVRLRQGQAIEIASAPGRYVALDTSGCAVALAEIGADGRLRSLRGFNRL
jgi:tRNA Pseudouridine synthase II, C terminal